MYLAILYSTLDLRACYARLLTFELTRTRRFEELLTKRAPQQLHPQELI